MAVVHSGPSYDMYIYCPQCSFIVQLSIFQIYSENWFMLIQFVQFNTNTVQYMFDCMFTLCIWTVCKYTECFIGHSSLMTVTTPVHILIQSSTCISSCTRPMSLWTGTAVVAVMQYTRYGVWPLPKASVCAGQLQMDACCVPCSAQLHSNRALQFSWSEFGIWSGKQLEYSLYTMYMCIECKIRLPLPLCNGPITVIYCFCWEALSLLTFHMSTPSLSVSILLCIMWTAKCSHAFEHYTHSTSLMACTISPLFLW